MKKICLFLWMTSSLMFSSCSVMMAAKKEGISITQVQKLRTRGQLIAAGAILVSSEISPQGELVEVYQVQNARGSAARAFMHGLLDVSTCGLWEVIGTPIEAYDGKEFYCIRVNFDAQECIRRVELL